MASPSWGACEFEQTVEVGEVKPLRSIRLFVTPRTVAYQASPSMGFSKQGYWSGLPFLSQLLESFSSVQLLSRVGLFATPWTAACQTSLSIINSLGFPGGSEG